MSEFDINKFINTIIENQNTLLINIKEHYNIVADNQEILNKFSLDKNKLLELVFKNLDMKITFNNNQENNFT
jgi:hypothetical protein